MRIELEWKCFKKNHWKVQRWTHLRPTGVLYRILTPNNSKNFWNYTSTISEIVQVEFHPNMKNTETVGETDTVQCAILDYRFASKRFRVKKNQLLEFDSRYLEMLQWIHKFHKLNWAFHWYRKSYLLVSRHSESIIHWRCWWTLKNVVYSPVPTNLGYCKKRVFSFDWICNWICMNLLTGNGWRHPCTRAKFLSNWMIFSFNNPLT